MTFTVTVTQPDGREDTVVAGVEFKQAWDEARRARVEFSKANGGVLNRQFTPASGVYAWLLGGGTKESSPVLRITRN